MKNLTILSSSIYSFAALLFISCQPIVPTGDSNWPHYQGDPGSSQYSQLNQITADNVTNLQVAWIYKSGDVDTSDRSQIQCNPIIVDGTLYGTSPVLKLFALDAATGEEKWIFNPFEEQYEIFGMGVNRGLAYWTDGTDRRILFSAGSFLHAVNADDGTQIRSFGDDGRVDLHDGLGKDARDFFVTANTPGVIFKDMLIVGSRVSEAMGAAPGYIRAFDVHSGEIRWIFHTIPKEGEPGHQTWPPGTTGQIGGANAWSGMSVDHDREIVFVPTGSAAYDFYGGDRLGQNLYANCLLALNANTGELIWHYQVVRHDLWDRDLPAPPNLVTVRSNGKAVDAVAQITKSSHVFLFDRETGEPLFPIEEFGAPPSNLDGEEAWTSQPIPSKPPAFARETFEESEITTRTDSAHAHVKAIWQNLRRGMFEPPSEEGTIIIPGFDGGGEWGGAAVDPDGIMYVNASEMPWIIQMIKYEDEEDGLMATRGKNLYSTWCLLCHGRDLKGASIHTVPSLVDLGSRRTQAEVGKLIRSGQGMMPSFAHLTDDDVDAITAFLYDSKEPVSNRTEDNEGAMEWKYPYYMNGYVRFTDHEGYPAIDPPWGTLNAVDLNRGEIKWKVTLGNHPELEAEEITGSESYGGPIVTGSGLIFIAGTLDEKIRAFEKQSGRQLWEADLPAAGYATPSTYSVHGKQYVVIACGGGKIGTKSGDAYVAFALPD
ncbi:MAG: PQQ-binding-like beta-propeller repeat protein [Saprospiraceae bacterium]|nr:PQQ-binding-like beta-propeller repeat protein [Saprospiraceae bacterium]